MSAVWTAFGLTLFAGMATGIGSAIAFFARRTNHRFLSLATGFSAGVMLYVSFVEILPKGGEALAAAYGDSWAGWVNAAGDVTHGMQIGTSYCAGFLWSPALGWIGLGAAPTNGWLYTNLSADDWGVNHDGLGRVCVRKVTSFRRSCRKDCLSDGGLTVAAPLPIVVVEPVRDERPDPQDVQSAVR